MNHLAILYIRKSTDKQEHSFEAQEQQLKAYCEAKGLIVWKVFREEVSGAATDRPVLEAAVKEAVEMKGKLVVLRLDRLARRLSTLARLLENTRLKICVAELDECVDPFVLGVLGLLAVKERELISKRTKEALALLKSQGVQLGNPDMPSFIESGKQARIAKGKATALKFGPYIHNFRLIGLSYREIAQQMNLKTAKGTPMASSAVGKLHKRYLQIKDAE